MHKSGFVSIVGRPNVGKSTLINQLIGQKLSIISPKPQTTRTNVVGIINNEDYQIVITDTPGYHKPQHKLGKYMINEINTNIKDVDLILFVTTPYKEIKKSELELLQSVDKTNIKKILLLNKIDENSRENIAITLENYKKYDFEEFIPISALKGKNLNIVLESILKNINEGPKYYDEEIISTREEKFFVSEIIREKMLKLLQEEIPHGIGVEIINMKLSPNNKKYIIEGNIFCEKENHKSIIIGKQGDMLKKISTYAREDIEIFLRKRVHIRLWVKVRKSWRDNNSYLKELGYK